MGSYSFLTSAVDGVEWSASGCGSFLHGVRVPPSPIELKVWVELGACPTSLDKRK